MPYAIYELEVAGQIRDFGSSKKDKAGVLGDVIACLQSNRKQSKVPVTAKVLEADLTLVMMDISGTLNDVVVRVLEVVPPEVEGKIDFILNFLERAKHISPDLTHAGNKDALITLGRIEFGVRRVLSTRLCKGYLHLSEEEKAEADTIFNNYYGQAFVFLSTASQGYTEEAYHANFNKYLAAKQ